ncbi:MAG TPA: lysylphosphatidylglycerol synthase domain-containing protein [Pseudolabrys sp.]|nr:lysylphosphatidylglycerol synthase domain-containing protein [Pseudolabrys sp.]
MIMHALKAAVSVALLVMVIALVAINYDTAQVFQDIRGLSPAIMALIAAALLANALAAVLRFQVIATEVRHPIGFRRAMAVVGAGSLGGAVFFQLAGQLMARGMIASRGGIPFAAVVVITAYERFIAAIVSALIALAGALYIFGNVYLDQSAGGADLIKIMCGLLAATAAGALLGYGRMAVQSIAPLLTQHFVQRCLGVIGLTLVVQAPMMLAYVAAARALSPETPLADLVAASAVVMFAASVPVSLAGWGVREMSAVVALGAIGVAAHAALAAAVIIGIGSLVAMGLVAALSLPGSSAGTQVPSESGGSIDYYRALAWGLPLAAATLVLFQIYVPTQSGVLNVNLADPLAMLAGVIFVLAAIRMRRLPRWRVANVNAAVAAATIVLAVSLLIGAWRFGWTEWAVVNRFLGWFVLLAYAATGALIVREGGEQGLRTFMLTFVGATAAVAALEIVYVILAILKFDVPVVLRNVQAFSLNHNFFAFQLVMALAAVIVFLQQPKLRIGALVIILAAFWFAGSRSGWIAGVFVLAIGLYLRNLRVQELSIATLCLVLAAILALLPSISSQTSLMPQIIPSGASTQERLTSIVGGLDLFVHHPIFGAGLGAFRNKLIPGSGGSPLLIHSTAVWLLAELGILGFLVFAIPGLRVFFDQWRSAREPASALVVLCLVAFGAMSAPADMLYQRTFWLLMGAALALAGQDGQDRTEPFDLA